LELSDLIINETNSLSKIEHEKPRIGDINYSVADITKITKLDVKIPKTTLFNGLKQTIEYYKNVSNLQ